MSLWVWDSRDLTGEVGAGGGLAVVDTSKPLLPSRLNSSSRSGVKDRPSESLKLFSRGMITNQERFRT